MRVVPFFMLVETNLLKAIPNGILGESPSYVFWVSWIISKSIFMKLYMLTKQNK